MIEQTPLPDNPEDINPLSKIKVTITLEQLFNLSYYRRHEKHLTVNEVWLNEQNLRSLPDIDKILHFQEVINAGHSAIATLVEIHKIQDWEAKKSETEKFNTVVKEHKEELAVIETEAKKRHTIIEEWKKVTLFTMMKKKPSLTNKEANEYLIRFMNPVTPFEKKMAEILNYPYREENTKSNE